MAEEWTKSGLGCFKTKVSGQSLAHSLLSRLRLFWSHGAMVEWLQQRLESLETQSGSGWLFQRTLAEPGINS